MDDLDTAPLPSARGLPPRPGSSASVAAVLNNGMPSGQQSATGSPSLPTAASFRRQKTGASVSHDAGYLTAEEPYQTPPGVVVEPAPLVLRTAPSARNSAAVTASGGAGTTAGPTPRGQPHLGLIDAAAALLSESITEAPAPAGLGAGPGSGADGNKSSVGGGDEGGDVGRGGGDVGGMRLPPSSSGPRAPPPVSLAQALEEVRSVRPSETQVEQLGAGGEGKGGLEVERGSSFSTRHALALKGSGELPPIQGPGHSYVALPGWVSSLPLTSPTAPPAGQGAAQGGGGGGQGVRFTASVSDRPPSAGPARGGVLAARRRLTVMRQSLGPALAGMRQQDVGDGGANGRSGSGRPASPGSAEGLPGSDSFQDRDSNNRPSFGKRPTSPSAANVTTPQAGGGAAGLLGSASGNSAASGHRLAADGGGVTREVLAKRAALMRSLAPWKLRVLAVMNHMLFYWFLVFLTFFIIFEDDLKKACLPPAADLPLEITITTIIIIFTLEMVLSSLVRPGYFLGFYFWLDAVATCSLVFEVPSVRIKFFGGSEYINLADTGGFVDNAGDQLYISSKAGRVARIFRLMRMLRLYGLYEQYVRRRRIRAALEAAGSQFPVAATSEQLSMIEFEMQQEAEKKTRVGTKLEELITRRVIVGILIMILLIPAFDIRLGTFGRARTVAESGLKMLHAMAAAEGRNTSSFGAALGVFYQQVPFRTGTRDTSLIFSLVVANHTYRTSPPLTERRFEDLYYVSYNTVQCPGDPGWPAADVASGQLLAGPDGCLTWSSFAVYDYKWWSQVASILNMARSLFIVVLLVTGAYYLNRDSRNLVLLPIERMLQRLQELADNPLAMAESRLQLQGPWQDRLQALEGDAGGKAPQDQQQQQPLPLPGPGKGPVDGTATLVLTHPGAGGAVGYDKLQQQHTTVSMFSKGSFIAAHNDPTANHLRAAPAVPPGKETAVPSSTNPLSGGSPLSYILYGMSRLLSYITVGGRRLRDAWQRGWQLLREWWTYLWEGGADADQQDGTAVQRNGGRGRASGRLAAGAYETEVLENSIGKIGALLAIGFGDAGAEVIAENIRNDGDINPMVPGRKTVALFGFCDIRRFTDATEVLQEEVMEFVNSIAHIVHTSVSLHGGSPNKNIGDAFLLVWKFPRGFKMRDISNVTRDRRDASKVTDGPGQPALPMLPDSPTAEPGPPAAAAAETLAAALATAMPPPLSSGGVGVTSVRRRALPLSSFTSRVAPAPSLGQQPGDSPAALSLTLHQQHQMQVYGARPVSRGPVGGMGAGGGAAGGKGVGALLAGSSLAHSLGLAQMADESLVGRDANGQPLLANKMAVVRALMGLKHEVDLSWQAKREAISAIADSALASFVLINVAIKRSARLKRYCLRPDLNARMPGYRVSMGFGLHVGWAIEGAIGSEYKIDASYLSPNVNMASRLEAATKQFGVLLLLSEDFVECLSGPVRERVRQIDCVTVKGSTQPLGLFTYDINLEAVPEPSDREVELGDDSCVEELLWRSQCCANPWAECPELTSCWGIDADFREDFNLGFQAYRVGDWPEARRRLESCRTALTDGRGLPRVDGPSDVLLGVMAQHGYTAPRGWRGFRELTEK